MPVRSKPVGLYEVAEFMNVVRSELTADQWERLCKKSPHWLKDEPNQPLKASIEEARTIRGELHQVLWALCSDRRHFPVTIKQDLVERMHISISTLLSAILSKLDTSPIQFKWSVRRVKTGGVVIRHGGKQERLLIEVIPMIEDIRTGMYYVLAEAFRLGSISTLRICPNQVCGKYFVAKDPRQHFCSSSCRDTFNNHRKSQLGKHRDYYKDRQDRKLAKARRLQAEGKSPEEVEAATKLPAREIRKLFTEIKSSRTQGTEYNN